jgi:hypothetical protein
LAGAAACLLLWQALILAVSAPAHALHSSRDAGVSVAAGALCVARAEEGGGPPSHPDPHRPCIVCALGQCGERLIDTLAASVVTLLEPPSTDALARRAAVAAEPSSPTWSKAWASRAPPSRA